MNEPLIARPGISFSGKTYNKHPQWYNQPLRLNEEQKRNPLEVFEEFFQCYHLNETRQIFWDWLTEVVSSLRSISSDSNDRSNHMYFYEKMEELIEAAFIITKRSRKQWRKKEKKRRKRLASGLQAEMRK
jgi:hypothetical protein